METVQEKLTVTIKR